MQIILVKLTLYVTEKCQKKKKSPFISSQNPFNLKKMCPPLKKSKNFHAVPAASTAALALLFLACYFGFTTICRRNGNGVDPNQTDSCGAG